MVRTKADGGSRKAVAARAPRKVLGGGGGGGGGGGACNFSSPKAGKVDKYAGGNVVCPRPTPDWQKNITGFIKVQRKENTEPKEKQDSRSTKENKPQNEEVEQMDDIEDVEEIAKSKDKEDETDKVGNDLAKEVAEEEPSGSTSTEKPLRNGLISDDSDDE